MALFTRFAQANLFFTLLAIFLSGPAFSGILQKPTTTKEKELSEGYFLVAGVFGNVVNASTLSADLKAKGYTSDYAFSPTKKLYYCYVLHEDSLSPVKAKYEEFIKVDGFANAWILRVHDHNESKIEEILIANKPVVKAPPVAKPKSEAKPGHPVRDLSATHHTYHVTVNVHDANNKEINAPIKVVGENDRVLSTHKPDQEFALHIPKKESQTVHLTCEAFGYHKTVIGLPLGDKIALASMPGVKISGQNISVDFVMEDCQKGDLMIMPNVFFHPNSNIMRLKSEDDLKTLLMVMNKHENLRIAVHGHTNGNSSGPITMIPEDCDNFFSPSKTEETRGSSMKLSLLRAYAIRMYLVKNGIAPERITIEGWGGKKMIHKEDSPQYQKNVRVEIEVLDI